MQRPRLTLRRLMIIVAVVAVALAVVACKLDDVARSRRLTARDSAAAERHRDDALRHKERAESLWRSARQREAALAELENAPGGGLTTTEIRRREGEIDLLRDQAEHCLHQATYYARMARRFDRAASEPLRGAPEPLPEPR